MAVTPELSRRLGRIMDWIAWQDPHDRFMFIKHVEDVDEFDDMDVYDQAIVLDAERDREAGLLPAWT